MTQKPCPFCGHKHASLVETDGIKYRAMQCDSCGAHGPEVRFDLSVDRVDSYRKVIDDATAEWNRRADGNGESGDAV